MSIVIVNTEINFLSKTTKAKSDSTPNFLPKFKLLNWVRFQILYQNQDFARTITSVEHTSVLVSTTKSTKMSDHRIDIMDDLLNILVELVANSRISIAALNRRLTVSDQESIFPLLRLRLKRLFSLLERFISNQSGNVQGNTSTLTLACKANVLLKVKKSFGLDSRLMVFL